MQKKKCLEVKNEATVVELEDLSQALGGDSTGADADVVVPKAATTMCPFWLSRPGTR